MSRWTQEQEAAIIAKGASLAVSAAAGSGKTSVLVERLIRLLADDEHPTPAERVVVVTFTNDAAAEVRQRLELALSAKLEQSAGNVWLRRQQTMLQSAKISTIHSFCFDLLREQFSQLQIAPGFRIIEAAEEDGLRAALADAAIEQFYARANAGEAEAIADRDLLLEAFCDKEDKNLDAMLLSLYRCVESVPFGIDLLSQAAEKMEGGDMLRRAFGLIGASLEEIEALYDGALHAAQPLGHEKLDTLLEYEGDMVRAALRALEQEQPQRLADCLTALAFADMPRAGKQYAQPAEARAMAVALRTLAKEKWLAMGIWATPLRYAQQDIPRHSALLMALYRLLCRFDAILWEEKCVRNVVGFADAMKLALRLLAEKTEDGTIVKTPLAEQLSQQYDIIMIDEFQDADNQQDLIFRMLSRGGSAERYGENLFVVGDSKQCIYRFRAANPANFMRAMTESVPYTSPQLTENTCIRLNRNFRSAKEVIGFVNHVFRMLMTDQVGEIAYDDDEALVQGAEYPEGDRPVELLLLQSVNRQAHEPEAVAKRIAWHLQNGTQVKARDGALRPCQPKDFLILLRTATQMPRFADALTAEGIPVCAVETKSYLKSPEITLLLEILRAVDNPLLDVSMAAAMLSPMLGFTPDDLVTVRLADRKGSLFQALRHITEQPQDYDEAFVKKCTDYLAFLESLRLFSAMETPEQLIRRVYHQTDFLGMMQLAGGGAQKKANLRALLSYARQFENNRGGGLSAFLRYLDAILARNSDLEGGGVLAGTDNVVNLKTIHKSKGLEAPFVIVAHTENLFSDKDRESDYQHHHEAGFGFRLHDPETYTRGETLPYETIAAQNKRESVSEEMRLLYVALTRARERLILPIAYGKTLADRAKIYAACQNAFGGQTDLLTRNVHSMREWLLMALIGNPSCEALREILKVPFPADMTQPPLALQIITGEEIFGDDAEASEAEGDTQIPVDETLIAEMQTRCAWHYDSPYAGLTAKYGVSELAKAEDFSAPLRRPLFTRARHGLSGAERGTALHTFMEHADFAAAAADLGGEIQRLAALGRLTQRQAEAVAASDIGVFFTSPLYARIAAAKSVQRERKFTVRLADMALGGALAELGKQYAGTDGLLIGIMDLVLEEEQGMVLVDYKTDRNVTAEELLERYSEQLRLYAAALRLLTGQPVTECCLYSLWLQKTVTVSLSD